MAAPGRMPERDRIAGRPGHLLRSGNDAIPAVMARAPGPRLLTVMREIPRTATRARPAALAAAQG